MVQLVKPRPIKKIRRHKYSFSKFHINIGFKNIVRGFLVFIFVFLVIYVVIYMFKSTIFKPELYINKINYAKASVDNYNDPVLYRIIRDQLKGENFYVINKFNKSKILDIVREKYPIVNNIEYVYADTNTVNVYVHFNNLNYIIKLGDNRWGIYSGFVIRLSSGDLLGNRQNIIQLPEYLSGLNDLEGLFFDHHFDQFIYSFDTVFTKFGSGASVVYFPGPKRIAISTRKNNVIYINVKKSIDKQIENYDFIKQYYKYFDNLQSIDLGSLENNMLIIKK